MFVKEYGDARSFLKQFENILLEREAVSQLILYNAYQNPYVSSSASCLFGAVMDENHNSVLLFSNVEPYSMVVYVVGQDKESLMAAAAALAQHIAVKRIPIRGILAKNELCQSFLTNYKNEMNYDYIEKRGMDIMEIRKMHEITPTEGMHRLANENEIKNIVDWMIQYQMEAMTSELDYEEALKKATLWINHQQIFVFVDNENTLLTMAVVTREIKNGVGISYIFTPEEFRGKAYAAANLYYLSRDYLNKGYQFCSIFVDKKQPISARAYEKIGYVFLEDIYEYTILS